MHMQAKGNDPVDIWKIKSCLQNKQKWEARNYTDWTNKSKDRHFTFGLTGFFRSEWLPKNSALWRVVCPPAIHQKVVWQAHAMTRIGVNWTLSSLQLAWYWAGMTADVRQIIKTCEVCQMAKHGGIRVALDRQRLLSGRPRQKVALVLVGPLPETLSGNKWILVLTDQFTRWQDTIAIPDARSPMVAPSLDEKCSVTRASLNKYTRTKALNSNPNLWRSFATYGMSRKHTTPYHPQANKIVEKNNRLLKDSLRVFLLRIGHEELGQIIVTVLGSIPSYPSYHYGITR